ncbi:primosomal protein [Salmonella enterica]|uniref:HP1 family phage holin n=1 Tax=Citrobacter freundii TaxID=546 RepID=UPI00169A47DD|nr:primosomal protein [Escherichia coli]EHA0400820.1 primosomal protein [Salmonella enterica]ELX8412080.1 primosomal protein [Enterobacter bugandensis]
MGLSMEKITTFIAYWLAVGLAYFGAMSPEKLALYVGSLCAIFTAVVNFWYRRKTFRYLTEMGIDKGVTRELNR